VRAVLNQTALEQVSVAAVPGAQLPLALTLRDESGAVRTLAQTMDGRPAVLILADYTCKTLCGPAVSITSSALAQTGLTPGSDYRLIVIGLNPKDGAAEATAMKRAQIGSDGPLAAASVFLNADESTVNRIANALGYRYAYDAQNDQFAHPAAAFVLTAEGRVARTLSGLGLTAQDLRLVLVEAGKGSIGTFADQVRLLCYGFDPAAGVYTATVHRWLAISSVATVALLFGAIAFMLLGRRTVPS